MATLKNILPRIDNTVQYSLSLLATPIPVISPTFKCRPISNSTQVGNYQQLLKKEADIDKRTSLLRYDKNYNAEKYFFASCQQIYLRHRVFLKILSILVGEI